MSYRRGRICDEHVAQKEVKIGSKSAPWITNEIRCKIKTRFSKQQLAPNASSCGQDKESQKCSHVSFAKS